MTAASLAKAGPGFCGRGDFLARRGFGFDFLRGRESFFGGMRAFFPGGITVRRAEGFDKWSAGGKKEGRKKLYHRGRNEGHRGHREAERVNAECAENAEFAEKRREAGRGGLG